jgi:dTDP-4-dehydrorhamnose reductase
MKILVTGNKGQLGNDTTAILRNAHTVFGVDIEELDITAPSLVERMVRDFQPDVIINCAAFTRVDACETETESARRVNVEGPKNLAIASDRNGSLLVHVSTDYVFDGVKSPPEPYTETDVPIPASSYGKTKLDGERAVEQFAGRYLIVRTAWLYGICGHNFLKTMLRLALKDPAKEIRVVDDQFGSPTWSHQLGLQIAKLIETDTRGTYHASAEGYCTWYALARHFLEAMEVPHTIVPCTTEEYPTPARRPKNSILENSRLKSDGINIMIDWRDALERFVSRFRHRLIDENEKDE